MKSQKDCQEYYAGLLEAGEVVDSRFTVVGSSWPLQLALVPVKQDPPSVVITERHTNAVAVKEEEKQEEQHDKVNPVAAAPPQKKQKKSSSSGRGSKRKAAANAKKRLLEPSSVLDEEEEEEVENVAVSHVDEVLPALVPSPSGATIRAKVLEGDEVVVYVSPAEDNVRVGLLIVNSCTGCGSFEEQKAMLMCSNCAHSYHMYCLQMKNLPEDLLTWKCPQCKRCEHCHASGNEEWLLVCEKCDLGYHTFCLETPLPFVPHGDWLCHRHAKCVSCGTKTAGDNPFHTWHDNDTLCHLCWTRIRNKNQCPSCLKAYDNNQWDDSFMVGCSCGRWVHRGCDGISVRLYEELHLPSRENESYYCCVCRGTTGKRQFDNPELLAMLDEEESASAIVEKDNSNNNNNNNNGNQNDNNAAIVVRDEVPQLLLQNLFCAFCGVSCNKDLGRMVPVSRTSDLWVHAGCAVWSRDVVLKKTGGVSGLQEAVQRARLVNCAICNVVGASLHCKFRGCSVAYHLPCALRENRVSMHRAGFLCSEHADPLRGPAPPVELAFGKPFVTLAATIKGDRSSESQVVFVTQSWEDRLKEFIAKNPSAFLNQQYEANVAQSKMSARDTSFKVLARQLSNGVVMQRGSLTVVSFGTVSYRAAFHTSRYIFPIGFVALRRFWSYRTPATLVQYRCSIQSRNDEPLFCIEVQDDPENPIVASASPADAWKQVAKRFAGGERGQGDLCWREEMFGMTAWVVSAIECLPGAGACAGYNFQFWPRAAAMEHSNAMAGNIEHPLGCARAIPYSKGSLRKDVGAFVYSRVTGASAPNRKKNVHYARANASTDVPDFIRNRKLEQHPPKLVVHKSRIHGMGVYTLSEIKQHDFIIEYQGEIIRSLVADKREREYESRGIPCYLWKLDEQRIVDATFCGNMARFINHCHDPNCVVDIVNISGVKKVMVSAKRDLVAGEELTYDYCCKRILFLSFLFRLFFLILFLSRQS